MQEVTLEVQLLSDSEHGGWRDGWRLQLEHRLVQPRHEPELRSVARPVFSVIIGR